VERQRFIPIGYLTTRKEVIGDFTLFPCRGLDLGASLALLERDRRPLTPQTPNRHSQIESLDTWLLHGSGRREYCKNKDLGVRSA
jgi:hypothetical protein